MCAQNPERPITRPNRIPETAEELNAKIADILTSIRDKMATVVEAAQKELRIQVSHALSNHPSSPYCEDRCASSAAI